MPALNFQKQFAAAVESGEKRQTIRLVRKNPIKRGDKLYLFTGQRTKWCRRLVVQRAVEVIRRFVKGLPLGHVVECKRVEEVAFGRMEIDGHHGTWFQGPGYLKGIAKRDGFDTEEQMLVWFDKTHGLPFEGVLIRW